MMSQQEEPSVFLPSWSSMGDSIFPRSLCIRGAFTSSNTDPCNNEMMDSSKGKIGYYVYIRWYWEEKSDPSKQHTSFFHGMYHNRFYTWNGTSSRVSIMDGQMDLLRWRMEEHNKDEWRENELEVVFPSLFPGER